ncbi:MAG TPA: type II toxin-antitoxin system PemK/MazF family toxin [Chitinophagaceae bacterium]|nr:type II toxin-antitoxin system PemK/MazF family toxin [Chitinophagaceae bacterium]
MQLIQRFWDDPYTPGDDFEPGTYLLNEPGVPAGEVQEGDIALVEVSYSAGVFKVRPALILRRLPVYDDFLVCGISSNQQQYIHDFDELVEEGSEAFALTGLHRHSVIRLSALAAFPANKIMRSIGSIPPQLHKVLLQRLSEFFNPAD